MSRNGERRNLESGSARPPNVLILNTHSVLNSGDTAIVLGQIKLLRELLGDPRITVTSRTPDEDRDFYDRLGVVVLPPLFPAPSVFGSQSRKLVGCARGLVSLGAKRQLLAQTRNADLVISSGGGYFFSTRRVLPGPMFWQAFLQVRIAQRLGKTVVFAPQSFGPFANRLAARSMRRLLSHGCVRKILVREPISFQHVSELLAGDRSSERVSLCPDLAFLLDAGVMDTEPARRSALPAPVLAVTVRDWLFPERRGATARAAARKAYLEAVAVACAEFFRRFGGSICVFAQSRGPGRLEDDRAISGELVTMVRPRISASHLAFVELPEAAPPDRIVSTIRAADLLLASRFHSAILAMVAGRPAIALGYQPKSQGMMTMLGLERFSLPMDGFEPSRLFPLIEEVLADSARFVAERVRPAISAMRSQIRVKMREAFEPFLPA